MEGVLADISPEINMVQIAAARMKGNLLEKENWKKQLKGTGKKLYRSVLRAIDIPTLAADFLQGCMKGETKINLDLHASDDLAWLMRRLIRNIVLGALGYGAADQFQYYLYYGYDAEDVWNSGAGRVGIFWSTCDFDVFVYQTFYEEVELRSCFAAEQFVDIMLGAKEFLTLTS